MLKIFPMCYDMVCRIFLENARQTVAKISQIANLEGKVVCDIGAGTGRIARVIDHTKVKKYYFVEPEKKFIAYARRNIKNNQVSYVHAEGKDIDEKIPESIDVALFIDSFHHIEEKDQGDTLHACYKKLRDRGFIILVEFDYTKIMGKIARLMEKIGGEPGSFYTQAELSTLLESIGFKNIKSAHCDYVKMLPQMYLCGVK